MSFILIISIFLAITSLTKAETVKDMSTACQNEVGLSPEMIEKVENLDFPDDPSYKKFLSCLLKKQNFQDDAGNVSLSDMINHWGDFELIELLDEVNKSCETVTGYNDAEKAYNAMICLFETLEKLDETTLR